ncbi:phenoloxidase-activating factor 1-like [Diabrotica virgifera virgifera]|uniref:CLIP domain-containing serine protease n=1 Tax=Diabrotica virgifera virgifera TaxID=50390 RepID=A0ABM5ILB8_DIAVI|nr:phenoloxidase-activating factor 1-like [Diabrotica virgifera virgifera]
MDQKCCLFLLYMFCIGSIVAAQLKRGQSCKTPIGETATCVSVYDCKLFIKAINRQNPLQLMFITRSQCGFDTRPLVCCGSVVDFPRSRNPDELIPVGSNVGLNFNRSRAIPNRRTCGFQASDNNNNIEAFIVGGTEAGLKEFPWMALLGYRNTVGKIEWNCGGSLISNRYVLTAAHCVTRQAQAQVGQLTYVRLGEHNLKYNVDCNKDGICNKKAITSGISKIIIHKDYDTTLHSNDIALLRLSRKIAYTDSVRPICLPEPNEESLGSYDVLITSGWGYTRYGRSDVKLKVDLPFRNKDECTALFKNTNVKLNDNQICAGGEEGKDSCQGDSGGPLMKRSNKEILQWYQEGIISFGSTICGRKDLPGVYTKVSNFLPWIHGHVTA